MLTKAERKRLRKVWERMRSRCENLTNPKYPIYGARGVKVCKRWYRFDTFAKDVGRRPSPEHTLDRIDNDGDYKPSNVRWATAREQSNNTRTNVHVTIGGRTRTITEWADASGLTRTTIGQRIDRGWAPERLLEPHAHRVTFRGRTQSRSAWAREFKLGAGTLRHRLRSGWELERALFTPVRSY